MKMLPKYSYKHRSATTTEHIFTVSFHFQVAASKKSDLFQNGCEIMHTSLICGSCMIPSVKSDRFLKQN
jgi:hypothetical protein